MMQKRFVMGFDIGGSEIKGILWDGKKEVKHEKIPTPKNETDFKNKIRALGATLAFGKDIIGIGIAAAGVVTGTKIKFSPNIAYLKNFDLKLLRFNKPIKVDHDTRAFLRTESGEWPGKKVLALTIGTGIGRAFKEKGTIQVLKEFERPVKWERKYQIIRSLNDDSKLAAFLCENLSKIVLHYKPDILVIGGGVLARDNFFKLLKGGLKSKRIKAKIIMSSGGDFSGAIGAAMLIE